MDEFSRDVPIIIAEDKRDIMELYLLAAPTIFPQARVILVSKAEDMLAHAKKLEGSLVISDNDTESLMTGIEAMEALRRYERENGRVPVYGSLVTGLSNGPDLSSTKQAAKRAGYNEFHVKPIDTFEIFSQTYRRYKQYKLGLAVPAR